MFGISFEFPLLIANAPDTDAFTLDDSEHYAHWTQNFADECGYLRDPNHVLMKVEYTRALGIPDEELKAYVPMPETIGIGPMCCSTMPACTVRRRHGYIPTRLKYGPPTALMKSMLSAVLRVSTIPP